MLVCLSQWFLGYFLLVAVSHMLSGQTLHKLKFFPCNWKPETWEFAVRALTSQGEGLGLGQSKGTDESG